MASDNIKQSAEAAQAPRIKQEWGEAARSAVEISTKQRRPLSFHEAGHAVAARKLGIGVEYITMVATDTMLANVYHHTATYDAKCNGTGLQSALCADLMVALAGAAAQQIAGFKASHGTAYDGDIANIMNFAGRLAILEAGLPEPGPDEVIVGGSPLHRASLDIFARAWVETSALLQANWLAVERVAGALRKRDGLTQAELDHVIANGQRGLSGKYGYFRREQTNNHER